MSASSDTFEDYFQTLTLDCQPGTTGLFTWTPDRNTPDLVYYQVCQSFISQSVNSQSVNFQYLILCSHVPVWFKIVFCTINQFKSTFIMVEAFSSSIHSFPKISKNILKVAQQCIKWLSSNVCYFQCYTHNYLGWKIHIVDDVISYYSFNKGDSGASSLIASSSLLFLIIFTLL